MNNGTAWSRQASSAALLGEKETRQPVHRQGRPNNWGVLVCRGNRRHVDETAPCRLFGGTGSSMLAACILLGIMILPTIIGVTESAVRSVPESYYEGSLALGATKERSIFFVMLPAAKSGILAGVVLGIGRAIGETMAVIMVAGNQPRMPKGLLQGVRTMTANIVTEMGYASGLHREALIATGVVLFVFILIINLSLSLLNRRAEHAN